MSATASAPGDYALHFNEFNRITKVVVTTEWSNKNGSTTFCISVDYKDNFKKKAYVVHYDGGNIGGAAAFIAGQWPKGTFDVELRQVSNPDEPLAKWTLSTLEGSQCLPFDINGVKSILESLLLRSIQGEKV